MYKSFASVVKFLPKHFFLFDAIVNGIISLISFLDYSLLVSFVLTEVTSDHRSHITSTVPTVGPRLSLRPCPSVGFCAHRGGAGRTLLSGATGNLD